MVRVAVESKQHPILEFRDLGQPQCTVMEIEMKRHIFKRKNR